MSAMNANKRTAICGIGNELRGDDAVGPLVIEGLRAKNLPETVLLIDCGSTPENFAGKVLQFGPDRIIIIEAVEMGRVPGSIAEIPTEKIKAQLATTHKMPITLFIDHLQRSLPGAEIIFIGVQQSRTGFGEKMSTECRGALERAVNKILGFI